MLPEQVNRGLQRRISSDVGNVVRARRNELRLSQEEVAQRAGVSRPWLTHVEGGHPRAELGKLLSLFAELRLTVDLLMPVAGDGEATE